MGTHKEPTIGRDRETPALPPMTWADLRAELVDLAPIKRLAMMEHLLDGLEDQAPNLSAREVLHDLLIILMSSGQTIFRRSARQTTGPSKPCSEGILDRCNHHHARCDQRDHSSGNAPADPRD